MSIRTLTKRATAILSAAVVLGAAALLNAPVAHAQECTSVPGYAKRVNEIGSPVWYEDARCGADLNRPQPPRTPPPGPKQRDCLQGVVGDVACDRKGAERTAVFPAPVVQPPSNVIARRVTVRYVFGGTVTVGPITTVGGGGGSGGNSGSVTIGELSNPAKDGEVQEDTE